jgi:regulatory protein YycI of two-component signal transduction system YycFG
MIRMMIMMMILVIIIIIIIIIQLNSYLFTCKLNSPEANYKTRLRRDNVTLTKKIQNKAVYIIQFVIIYVPRQQVQ